MMKTKALLLLALSLTLSPTSWAGNVVMENMTALDYFSSGEGQWTGRFRATSTVPWPNWLQYEGQIIQFEDVIESGLMVYRCNPTAIDGCTATDPDTHRFVFTGPATVQFPDLSGPVVGIKDKLVDGLFRRSWVLQSPEDAIQTIAHYPFAEFTATDDEPLFPLGFIVAAHMADIDTIDAMLAGKFGAPLAHRFTQPCMPLRVVNGAVSSTQCHD